MTVGAIAVGFGGGGLLLAAFGGGLEFGRGVGGFGLGLPDRGADLGRHRGILGFADRRMVVMHVFGVRRVLARNLGCGLLQRLAGEQIAHRMIAGRAFGGLVRHDLLRRVLCGQRIALNGFARACVRALAVAVAAAAVTAAAAMMFVVAVAFAGGAGIVLDQRLTVGDRDLIVVRVDFGERQEAVAVAAVLDERRLQRRLDPGDFG